MWRILFTLLSAATLAAMIANTIRIDALHESLTAGRATEVAAVDAAVSEAESLILDDETTGQKYPKKTYWLHLGIPEASDTDLRNDKERAELEKLKIIATSGTDHAIFKAQAGKVVPFFYRPGQNIVYGGYADDKTILYLRPMLKSETEKFTPEGLTKEGVLMTVVGLPDLTYVEKFSS
jgi:hypothetical protein